MRKALAALAHGLTDDLMTGLAKVKLYPDGFGDIQELEALVARVAAYDGRREAPPIEVQWRGPAKVDRLDGSLVRRGDFRSPAADILPPASQTAPLELRLPAGSSEADRPPVVLLLAATGEQGTTFRRSTSLSLLRRGIGIAMLENPFYGARRPPGQTMAVLRTVRDQFAMNTATVDEAQAILAWLRARGHERVGASGYSQGGMMAAFAGALSDFETVIVPRAAGRSAVPIFTENALGRRFAWDKLAEPFGDEAQARQYFAQCLEPVDVGRFDGPLNPRLAIVVGSKHDRFIRPEEVESLHRHWKGAELRWVDAGHLTGALLGAPAHNRAIVEAFDRFQ
jgi:pimeloyl-ACP methyl ester carboxylesterase